MAKLSAPSSFTTSSSADFLIRTQDGGLLKVHKSILEESSPFWRDMLSLPQVTPASAASRSEDVVDIPEDESVMRALLELTYPIPDPTFTTIAQITTVLDCAVKFEMTEAIRKLSNMLLQPKYLKDQPTRVYAIACRYGLDELAQAASRETLRFSIFDGALLDEFKYITAHDYHRLLSLHRERSRAAQSLITLPDSIRCSQCSASSHYGAILPPKWWADFAPRAIEELKKYPHSERIFSWPFLAQAAKAGCQRCGTSIIESHDFFLDLKKKIDDLPDTI